MNSCNETYSLALSSKHEFVHSKSLPNKKKRLVNENGNKVME
jgi:hypothetical protein